MGIHKLIKISAVAVGFFISYLKIEFRNEFMWLAGIFFRFVYSSLSFQFQAGEIEIKRHDKKRNSPNFSARLRECA